MEKWLNRKKLVKQKNKWVKIQLNGKIGQMEKLVK